MTKQEKEFIFNLIRDKEVNINKVRQLLDEYLSFKKYSFPRAVESVANAYENYITGYNGVNKEYGSDYIVVNHRTLLNHLLTFDEIRLLHNYLKERHIFKEEE